MGRIVLLRFPRPCVDSNITKLGIVIEEVHTILAHVKPVCIQLIVSPPWTLKIWGKMYLEISTPHNSEPLERIYPNFNIYSTWSCPHTHPETGKNRSRDTPLEGVYIPKLGKVSSFRGPTPLYWTIEMGPYSHTSMRVGLILWADWHAVVKVQNDTAVARFRRYVTRGLQAGRECECHVIFHWSDADNNLPCTDWMVIPSRIDSSMPNFTPMQLVTPGGQKP